MVAIATPVLADDTITFDPAITAADFQKFSRVIGQGIYPTPVQPARSTGILHFDIGVAVTGVQVDEKADYWRRAVRSNSITSHGYAGIPRLVVSKGFGSGTISATYAKINDSGVKMYGAAIDSPIIRGTIASPELALRIAYGKISGIDVYRQKTYGAEVFLSKGFGPVTPYAAVGRQRNDARGTVTSASFPSISLSDKGSFNRYTAGVRISLFVPKLVIEATQAEVRSYSAKVSFGF